MNLKSGFKTDIGLKREKNEDNICAWPSIGLWAVADGIGGNRAGEVASRIALEKLIEDSKNGIPLIDAIQQINKAILEKANKDPSKSGMATTIVALKTDRSGYEIAWVGDSRAYLWDGNSIKQLTTDHSYVQHLFECGAISQEQMKNHPKKNVLTQALGSGVDVKVDFIRERFYENEQILLCSDGLSSVIEAHDLKEIFSIAESEQAAVEKLIALAKQKESSDNISAIIVSAPPDAPARELVVTAPLSPRKKFPFLVVFSMAILSFLLFYTFFLKNSIPAPW